MSVDYLTMIRFFSQIVWPMGRISGLILTVPFFSSSTIPKQIKVILIVILSWACASLVPAELSLDQFNAFYVVYMMQELILGMMMGFILQLVFQVFMLGAQIVSSQAGLAMAVMNDPSSEASIPLLGQFYQMMAILIFLSLNGHLSVLDTLMDSFNVMPIGKIAIDNAVIWKIISFSGWMFREATLISIVAILSLLIVNISFGIMSRIAPQLSIFSLGFPIVLLAGMLMVVLTLPTIAAEIEKSIQLGLQFMKGIVH